MGDFPLGGQKDPVPRILGFWGAVPEKVITDLVVLKDEFGKQGRRTL